MTDRLHDHTTFGFRRGCVACAQVEADMTLSRRSRAKSDLTAAGDALWERVMSGDPTAVPAYEKFLNIQMRVHGINAEGEAGLLPSTPG